jgi:hypothetical protein
LLVERSSASLSLPLGMGNVGSPRITYVARPNATPETELSALATVYRFILSKSNASQKAVEPAPKLDGHDDAKETCFPPGGGLLMGDGTSVGAVVRMRGR